MSARRRHDDPAGMRRNDGELIAASIDDADAFGELFDRHYANVHQFIHRRLGLELADELSSETFVQAFKSRDNYDAGKTDAAPWLFGIASNLIRLHARTEVRKLRAYARSGVDPVEEFAAATDARLAADADRRTLVAALAKLSKDEREVILMFAWAELTTAQIAEAIGTAEGTVRSRLSRARKKIRDRLDAENLKHARHSNRQEVGR